jgi:HEAT repeat protein
MNRNCTGGLLIAMLLLAGCNNETTIDTSNLPQPVNVVLQPTSSGSTLQTAAADALGRIGFPAVPQLSASVSDPDPIVRLQSCRALAYMGAQAKDAVPALVQALNDPEQAVREAAAAALGQVGQAAAPAVPALMQMLHGGNAAETTPLTAPGVAPPHP